MIFYLGTHKPNWLGRTDIPLFISRRALQPYKTLPRARGPWALDSGAFTEISTFGCWTITPETYVSQVRLFEREIGNLRFAAPMDWMCEPFILEKTGKSLREHQELTTANYLRLLEIDPELPWIPVLQGWRESDYCRHRDLYDQRGVDLSRASLVGLGSVCRRQNTTMAEGLIRRLSADGIRLHGFGFKLGGLRRAARYLSSSDSMAWSFDARRTKPLPGCRHKSCANCMIYALWWREKALRASAGSQRAEQTMLFNSHPPEECHANHERHGDESAARPD